MLNQTWTGQTEEAIRGLLDEPNVRYFILQGADSGVKTSTEIKKITVPTVLVKKLAPKVSQSQPMSNLEVKLLSNSANTTASHFTYIDKENERKQSLFGNIPDFSVFGRRSAESMQTVQIEAKKLAIVSKIRGLLSSEKESKTVFLRCKQLTSHFALEAQNDDSVTNNLVYKALKTHLDDFWNTVFVFTDEFDKISDHLKLLLSIISTLYKSLPNAECEKLSKSAKRLKTLAHLRGALISLL